MGLSTRYESILRLLATDTGSANRKATLLTVRASAPITWTHVPVEGIQPRRQRFERNGLRRRRPVTQRTVRANPDFLREAISQQRYIPNQNGLETRLGGCAASNKNGGTQSPEPLEVEPEQIGLEPQIGRSQDLDRVARSREKQLADPQPIKVLTSLLTSPPDGPGSS